MKSFSIITPVYNGAKYISKCIEAIANSEYDLNYVEHIIVDDGSTDETKQICETYAQKYKHIKFYSKINANWGSVINYVKHNHLAHNDYIVICDADDVILPKAFKMVDKKCNEADFVAGTFYLWNGKRRWLKVPSYFFVFKRHMVKKQIMDYYSPLFVPHCNYLSNRLFYLVEDLKEHVSYQDNIYFLNAFRQAKTVTFVPNGLSLYWQNRAGNTMSNVKNEKGQLMQVDNLRYYEKHNIIEPMFFILLGMKDTRKYVKMNHLTFTFANTKLNLKSFPFYLRPFLRLLYLIIVKKYIKKS